MRNHRLLAVLHAAVGIALVASHAGGATIERIALGQVTRRPVDPGSFTVHHGPLDSDTMVLARIHDIGGARLFQASASAVVGPTTHFAVPAGLPEGGHRLSVELVRSGEVLSRGERVYSVVANVADDVRYGFYTNFGGVGGDYGAKADLLADCLLNAVEYYDWFPAHGNYTPDQAVYGQEPFGQTIYLEDLQRKMAANRDRRIQNIAYIAAYAAVPRIAAGVADAYLLDDQGRRVVFYEGNVGAEEELGGAWFNLTAFARGTAWRDFLWTELRGMLDATGAVSFDGVELDTYGWTEPYHDAYGNNNGRPMMEMLADLTNDVQGLVRSIHPEGLTTLNNVIEAGITEYYGREDFLFVENWDFHKPRYDETLAMVMGHTAASGMRFVSKCYPADMDPGRSIWPAPNLALLMGAHLAGGGSFMVAGEPRETTGQIGGLNSLYYPDNQPQPAENFAVIRHFNALDAALYLRNHGPGVRPRATDLSLPNAMTTSFVAPGSATWCVLHTGGASHWTTLSPAPPALAGREITITLPNGLTPRRVLYGSPDSAGHRYPMAVPFTHTDRRVTLTIPMLQYFGAIVVEAAPNEVRLADAAHDPAYFGGWDSASTWQFSGRTESANIFIGSATGNGLGNGNQDADINTGQRSWGLFSGTDGLVDARRSFAPLAVGESLRVHLDNGFVESGGSVGLGLLNAAAENLVEFYFPGGQETYRVSDAAGTRDTGMGFTSDGLDLEFTLTSNGAYSVRIVPLGQESAARTVTGQIAGAISQVRFFSFNAGTDPLHDAFFNDLSIYRLGSVVAPARADAWMMH